MNNFQFDKYIKSILSKIIPKDIIDYVIDNYINTLKNLSLCFKKNMNKNLHKITKLAEPIIRKKYSKFTLGRSTIRGFDEKYICVVGVIEYKQKKISCSIFYNYITKCIIDINYYNYHIDNPIKTVHMYNDRCLYLDLHTDRNKGDYKLYNILSNETKRYIYTENDLGLYLFYKQFICYRVENLCIHCSSFGKGGRFESSSLALNESRLCRDVIFGLDRDNKSCQCADMILIDTSLQKIYKVNINPIYADHFHCKNNRNLHLTEKYIYTYNYKLSTIFAHDYINNVTKIYTLPNIFNEIKFIFIHGEIIYYSRDNKTIDLYRLDNFKYMYTIYFDDKIIDIIINNDLLEIGFSNSKKRFLYKIN